MLNIETFIAEHSSEIEWIKTQIATNFDVSAQHIINTGFSRMGAKRFDPEGNDIWEMVTCHLNGWNYKKPPAELVSRWARD